MGADVVFLSLLFAPFVLGPVGQMEFDRTHLGRLMLAHFYSAQFTSDWTSNSGRICAGLCCRIPRPRTEVRRRYAGELGR